MTSEPLVVAVAGPTASGKSDLALSLAVLFDGEIVNCDSLQMVRYLDIGSAKLRPEERHGIPHHFLDVLDPDEQFTAGEYMRQGREALREITARGKMPVIVGGTGFYLRALLEGLFDGPGRDEELRERLRGRAEAKGGGYLHRMLRRLDAEAAGTIHRNDEPKLIRALEVCLLAREPVSEMYRRGRKPLRGYRVLKIGLSPVREQLNERINRRTREMFKGGLVEEVRGILARGYTGREASLQSLGYRQAVNYLEGRILLEEALYHAKTRTRQYAKRQMSWFRREREVHWLKGFGSDEQVVREAGALVAAEVARASGEAGTE